MKFEHRGLLKGTNFSKVLKGFMTAQEFQSKSKNNKGEEANHEQPDQEQLMKGLRINYGKLT
jgi:hypothetical protein